jgi:repressor LexA
MARSNHDQKHLRRLRDAYARLGCIPSHSQIAAALGFKAKNAAYKLTQRLIASGHLMRSAGGRLVPGPCFFTLDACEDEVRAGFGGEGSASGLMHGQALDQILVSRPSRTVLLTVRGDSMVDAGILSGDLAVVEAGPQAVSGDIVVAEIDGVHTIKELRVIKGRSCLVPHGGDGEPVFPDLTLNVIGVVRGIVRSYRPRVEATAKLSK